MKIGLEIVGLEGLDAALAELGAAAATGLGEKAFRASAERLQQAWIAGAPYDPTVRKKYWTLKSGETRAAYYGHLRENIKIRKVRPQKRHAIVYGVHTGNAFWAYFLEYGTAEMPPHPWARPIVNGIKDDLVKVQVDFLREGIEVIARKRRNPGRRRYGAVMANGRNG